jgi:hypothetical protein
MFAEGEHDLDAERAVIRHHCVGLESVIAPAPLQTRRQGALQGRLGRFVEQVHHGLADDTLLDSEQLEPRGIGVDHDAFLHLDDRVVRPLQNRLELAACVVCRFERGVQGALQAEGPQLAQHDGLQPHRIAQ